MRGLRLRLCGRMGIQEQPSPSLHHPAGKVYKCGEHVGRAQSNNLKEAAKKTVFRGYENQVQNKISETETVKCKCKQHRAGCGCISDSMIKGASIKHFCCQQQCIDPDDYAQSIRVLWKYHVRDIHTWDKDGSCNFHPVRTCSCKKCERR